MERLDEDFLNELVGKIDERFKETSVEEKEEKAPQIDTGTDHKDINDLDLSQNATGDVAVHDKAETVTFDLTEEEVLGEKTKEDESGPLQSEAAQVSSRRYHPMEISTNIMVTKNNVEFAVRKFVKDLKECLRFSKAISVRFQIKTLNKDNGHS